MTDDRISYEKYLEMDREPWGKMVGKMVRSSRPQLNESEKQSPRIGIVNHKTPVEALLKWPSHFLECFAKAERGNGGVSPAVWEEKRSKLQCAAFAFQDEVCRHEKYL